MFVIRDILWGNVYDRHPEADDKESRMNAHSMMGSASCSLAKECKRLCDDEVRLPLVKVSDKAKVIIKKTLESAKLI